jgi:ribosomal protein S12 methylthiotransferase accessory factor
LNCRVVVQKLEGIDRHQRLMDSYKKLHAARAKAAASS